MNTARHRQERGRWSILTTVLPLLCIVVVSFAAPSRSLSSSEQLTTDDKRLLAAGELVMKQKNEQRGAYKLIGGQSWQIIDVPIDVAWRALQDLPGYKNFIPLATEADVKHQAGDEADLAIRQQWGPIDVRYVLQTTRESDRGAVMFRVDHSQEHDIRAGWGFIRVRPYKGERTLVSFGALVDIGDGVFVSIIRPAVRRDLLRIPTYFKRHVEGEVRGLPMDAP
ncbi:MAG: SRPBCC family protein [Myxococcales bacterium]|nr:MAG: SRPBCC family protein [Myxococcales bacterium]